MENVVACWRCPRLTCRQVLVTLTAVTIAIFLVYNLSCCVSITGRNELITASDGFHLRLGLDFTARSRSEQTKTADSRDSRWSKRSSSSSINHQPPWPLYELRKHLSKSNSKKRKWPPDNVDDEQEDNEVSEREIAGSDRGVAIGGALAPYLYRKGNFTALRKLPQALIIGVKKGGTRALLEYIRLHPDIRAVGPEMHFFDRHYYRGLDWYRRHMPRSLEGQLTMEKTPSYFVTRQVPRRVSDMSKDTKLLIVVRDPVTRAISDYTQTLSKRHDLKRFEELAFLGNTSGVVDTSWAAIRIGIYAKHLERWLRFFPRNQLHFVSGERLIKDPAGEMALVQDFLGLRRVITEQHFYFNETKGFPCLKKSEHNASPKCLGLTKGRSHPVIDLAAIQRLRDFYRPFNAKFYLMTGVNFGWP